MAFIVEISLSEISDRDHKEHNPHMENLIKRAQNILSMGKSENETADILRETERDNTLIYLAIKAAVIWV